MPLGTIEMRPGPGGKWPHVRENGVPLPDGAHRLRGWGALSPATIVDGLQVEYDLRDNAPSDVRRYAPVPEAVRQVLATHDCTHPGLILDKFAYRAEDQSFFRHTIDKVVEENNRDHPEFAVLFGRWAATLCENSFTGTTAGPLTLHLARASALENAGICLHRVYGFVFLPGSGLKGLARAFACEIWLGEQPDKDAAWKTICEVFGTAPSPWLNDLAKRHEQPAPKDARAGSVIFHDAWPEKWPKLVTDILNSHHPEYYAGMTKDRRPNPPPGDWEDPIPVYFLSVEPGTNFRFAIAPRRVGEEVMTIAGEAVNVVEQARAWLIGGLTQLGAGAKTASGYGDFTVTDPAVAPVVSAKRPSFTATLELVTPAFLAGAKQQQEDCDLRPSTLRGQLRWWWRTMHAGFVSVEDLRKMEAAIWGDTKTGGAVRVTVRKVAGEKPKPYDRQKVMRESRVPQPNDGSIPGLTYHSYGMDEAKGRRWYVEPGAQWSVVVTARASRFGPQRIAPDVVLRQATAALRLLCQYGGVGAKARKGFGSFRDLPGFDLAAVKAAGEEFRTACGLGGGPFIEAAARSSSLEQMLTMADVPTGGTAHWVALDQLAASVQQFIKGVQPKHARKWLGTPRKQKGQGAFGLPLAHEQRHASPALYHFAKEVSGVLVARAVGFPAAELPNATDSRLILTDLLAALSADLPPRFARPEIVSRMGVPPPRPAAPSRPVGPALAKGQRVTARITAIGKGLPSAEALGHAGIVLGAPKGLAKDAEVEVLIEQVPTGTKPIVFKWPK